MPVPGCNAWPGPKRRREENWEGGMEWRNNRWSRRPAASSSGWHQLGQQWPYAQQWPQDQQWQDDDQQWSGQQWPADLEWSGQHWGHQGWSGPEQCNGGKQEPGCPRLCLKWQTCLKEMPGTTQKHSGLTRGGKQGGRLKGTQILLPAGKFIKIWRIQWKNWSKGIQAQKMQ